MVSKRRITYLPSTLLSFFFLSIFLAFPSHSLHVPSSSSPSSSTFTAPSALNLSSLGLPPGFDIQVAASNLTSARSMVFSPDGTILFLGTYNTYLFALVDSNKDGSYEQVYTLSSTLRHPTGIAITSSGKYLVIATNPTILAYNVSDLTQWVNQQQQQQQQQPKSLIISPPSSPPPSPLSILNFTAGSQVHFLRSGLAQNKDDDNVYLSFPSVVNTNQTIALPYATLQRVNITTVIQGVPGSTTPEVIAIGVRDSQGMDFSPVTGNLWFTENGCEYLGFKTPGQPHCNFTNNNDMPPDELNSFPFSQLQLSLQIPSTPPLDFGFPLCVGNNIPDPTYPNASTNCVSGKVPSVANLEAHQAPLGLVFYPSFASVTPPQYAFPSEYYHTFFFASHGSTYRQPLDGYDVNWAQTVVLPNGTEIIQNLTTFASGWLQTFPNGTQTYSGRPDAVIVDPNDGSLLVSDDFFGGIYRIRYVGTTNLNSRTTQKNEVVEASGEVTKLIDKDSTSTATNESKRQKDRVKMKLIV